VLVHRLRPSRVRNSRQSPRRASRVAVARVRARLASLSTRARQSARPIHRVRAARAPRATARRTVPTHELAHAINGNRIHASTAHSSALAPSARAIFSQ